MSSLFSAVSGRFPSHTYQKINPPKKDILGFVSAESHSRRYINAGEPGASRAGETCVLVCVLRCVLQESWMIYKDWWLTVPGKSSSASASENVTRSRKTYPEPLLFISPSFIFADAVSANKHAPRWNIVFIFINCDDIRGMSTVRSVLSYIDRPTS